MLTACTRITDFLRSNRQRDIWNWHRKNLPINESMTKLLPNGLCFTMLATAQADPNHARDAKAIACVKQMPVSELDSTLPSISFEKWLGIEAGREADIRWEVNDCGEQTGTAADRGRDFPMCVEADAAMKDKRSIVIMIAVGSFKKGSLASRRFPLANSIPLVSGSACLISAIFPRR